MKIDDIPGKLIQIRIPSYLCNPTAAASNLALSEELNSELLIYTQLFHFLELEQHVPESTKSTAEIKRT